MGPVALILLDEAHTYMPLRDDRELGRWSALRDKCTCVQGFGWVGAMSMPFVEGLAGLRITADLTRVRFRAKKCDAGARHYVIQTNACK